MKKKKSKADQQVENLFLIVMITSMLVLVLYSAFVDANQITHKFKSPSFSGENTSSHYLTIENQEASRKKEIQDELTQALEDLEREKENTTVARFIRNLESRVYAELSRQLVNNLFGEDASTSGTINLEGNKITYTSDGDFITLTIIENDGTETTITLPINSFTF
tara:strand:+ start:861 stop:1355 length:495 start_codon:yes stop_codon:yes gene_type:complete